MRPFLLDSKGVPSQISAIFRKYHFLSSLEAADYGIRPSLFSNNNEVYRSFSPWMISPISTDLSQSFSDGIFVILWAMNGHFLQILRATDHGFALRLFFNDD
ncbi:unnamed protein product [Linum trigynum]|uniref:Uncharacterized protein n=1 Tax=Linum trigynum TaxID=586398 RepID=A0AAV2EKU8_9ROSI